MQNVTKILVNEISGRIRRVGSVLAFNIIRLDDSFDKYLAVHGETHGSMVMEFFRNLRL